VFETIQFNSIRRTDMQLFKRSPIVPLLIANALALALLGLPMRAAADGGDYCPAGSAGCHCWDGTDGNGTEWSPPGCYDQEIPNFDCHGGSWCE
jgi:hypothetical protein